MIGFWRPGLRSTRSDRRASWPSNTVKPASPDAVATRPTFASLEPPTMSLPTRPAAPVKPPKGTKPAVKCAAPSTHPPMIDFDSPSGFSFQSGRTSAVSVSTRL